jgi:catechol 2,3-dioxygenase-like lactoylglutathione lyase family enzyme
MYDHIGLKVGDLKASVRFYEAALAPLGHELCSGDAEYAGLGPRGEAALWLYAAQPQGNRGVHVAFRATTRAAVDRFHEQGLRAGGRDHGPPGVRADYSPTYYAAFLLDPDGNNVEAVCTLASPGSSS